MQIVYTYIYIYVYIYIIACTGTFVNASKVHSFFPKFIRFLLHKFRGIQLHGFDLGSRQLLAKLVNERPWGRVPLKISTTKSHTNNPGCCSRGTQIQTASWAWVKHGRSFRGALEIQAIINWIVK